MPRSDENEAKSDEREGSESPSSDEVEAHGITGSPSSDSPSADRTDEGDDVEAHILGSPSADRPSSD